MTTGIVSCGAYVPFFRLSRAAIATALGTPSTPGTRAVACHDEDTTSMGVEAARVALANAPSDLPPETLAFATATPAYADKTNATALHAALALDSAVPAYDLTGVRSGTGALRLALESPRPTLAVTSDLRTGLPSSADERDGGDAAAAVLCGSGSAVIAEYLGAGSATDEFLDRWRLPGDTASRVWEERFAESLYARLGEAALTDALKAAGITADDVDHLVATGLHIRGLRRVVHAAGVRSEAVVDNLADSVGNTGTTHATLLLTSVLEQAGPGEIVVVLALADGADAVVLRTTEAIAGYRSAATVADQVASGRDDLAYATFLIWRGVLRQEPPRRPEPDPPAAPPSHRTGSWKFAFVGSRCEVCGTRHLPPQRVCVHCRSTDQMAREPLAGVTGTIATYTIDRLAFSLSPPVVVAVVDFDGGGRFQCELTDVDAERVAIGDRVQMTFRRLFTADGVHNYFWKARPVRGNRKDNDRDNHRENG